MPIFFVVFTRGIPGITKKIESESENEGGSSNFAKFLISKFLKGLTYSALLYVNEVILGKKKRSRSPKAHNLLF